MPGPPIGRGKSGIYVMPKKDPKSNSGQVQGGPFELKIRLTSGDRGDLYVYVVP